MTSRDPAQLRRPGGRGSHGQRFSGRGYTVLVAAVLALSTGVSACSAPTPTVSSGPAGSVSANPPPGGQATPVAPPSGSRAPSAVSGAVAAALRALVASTPQPSREQVRQSLSAAGFAPAAVEVSASRTPTGLAADAVDVGVLGEGECVMAQVRSGTVESSVLPVLPNGRCFVGSIQR
ncbi:hypothetical protein WMO79_15990 [Micrococcaceae bacterium Sec7.4]